MCIGGADKPNSVCKFAVKRLQDSHLSCRHVTVPVCATQILNYSRKYGLACEYVFSRFTSLLLKKSPTPFTRRGRWLSPRASLLATLTLQYTKECVGVTHYPSPRKLLAFAGCMFGLSSLLFSKNYLRVSEASATVWRSFNYTTKTGYRQSTRIKAITPYVTNEYAVFKRNNFNGFPSHKNPLICVVATNPSQIQNASTSASAIPSAPSATA